jgi:hypothetical protein
MTPSDPNVRRVTMIDCPQSVFLIRTKMLRSNDGNSTSQRLCVRWGQSPTVFLPFNACATRYSFSCFGKWSTAANK